jgi:hypothetical protein
VDSIVIAQNRTIPAVADGDRSIGILDPQTVAAPTGYDAGEPVIYRYVVIGIGDLHAVIAPGYIPTELIFYFDVVSGIVNIDPVVPASDNFSAEAIIDHDVIANVFDMYTVVAATNLPAKNVADCNVVARVFNAQAVAIPP